jgi:aminoglycoside 6'-N-acetyltransferase
VREGDLVIRRMRDDPNDYALMVRWRNEPHVARWWENDDDPTPTTLERIVEHYGPRTTHDADTTRCLIELAGRPIGYVQFYPWGAYEEVVREMGFEVPEGTFGIDIFVGEPDVVGSGYGSTTVDLLSRYLFDECGAAQIGIVTALDNHVAQRAYEKAGFRKVGELLDSDVRDGERVRSWLMTRDLPS